MTAQTAKDRRERQTRRTLDRLGVILEAVLIRVIVIELGVLVWVLFR